MLFPQPYMNKSHALLMQHAWQAPARNPSMHALQCAGPKAPVWGGQKAGLGLGLGLGLKEGLCLGSRGARLGMLGESLCWGRNASVGRVGPEKHLK